MEEQQDKRTFHALRKHIDEMLGAGATIVSRDPVTLLRDGQTLKVKHGMLVGYSALLDLVEPVSDHEWPDALRQMAIDLCIQQLDEAIRALEGKSVPARLGHSANDS
ncbi:hypothetical protein CH92_15995 [Stutzerimonas stutzeri]|uniref:Uncharacterized protein n=1 Tax=Stutzerimonas stutzeri TaxID=316 RepID=W8R0Y0_STUST|nr:hypothetical protein [Stutzerimonas stutzeri]AHL76515.1 hypothetical protein CH92_15995 [Stutzerimonas stutzeri]MCQ4329750.1 hypothetical protein [Stutzerimonas stutzeri]